MIQKEKNQKEGNSLQKSASPHTQKTSKSPSSNTKKSPGLYQNMMDPEWLKSNLKQNKDQKRQQNKSPLKRNASPGNAAGHHQPGGPPAKSPRTSEGVYRSMMPDELKSILGYDRGSPGNQVKQAGGSGRQQQEGQMTPGRGRGRGRGGVMARKRSV